MTRNAYEILFHINADKLPSEMYIKAKVTSYFLLQAPPEDLLYFHTRDAHHEPILHLILKESCSKPIEELLKFLHEIHCLEEVSTKVCAHDIKAGKCYPEEAARTLCAASLSDDNLNIVKSLLQADTDINDLQDDTTALMQAAIHGNVEIMKTLIKYKASVDYTNSKQETSLLLACKSRQWQAARLLIEHGANAVHSDALDETPLHVAITSGGVELVKHIAASQSAVFHKLTDIASFSDACQLVKLYPRLSNEQINEVVTQACLFRNTDILQHIGKTLENQALVTHITQAYQADHSDCLNILLKCTEGRSGFPCPDISITESCKHKELINLTKFLATKGKKNVNENNGEPLRMASQSGNLSAVEYLKQSCHTNVNKPDTQGVTALLLACKEGHLDIVDMLLRYGAKFNICAEETPLTTVCKMGHQEVLNRILQESPNLSNTNIHGMTPLEVAIKNGHTTLAAKLIQKGATISFENVSFYNLCQLGSIDQVRTFLQTCTEQLKANEKLLSVVVKDDKCELFELILRSTKITKSTEFLGKALEYACAMGTKAIVEQLIKWEDGKLWNLIKHKPESHLLLAITHQHKDIVELLLAKGSSLQTDSSILKDIVKSKDILKLMLKQKMSQSWLNEALLVACSSRHIILDSSVRLLLKASADVNYHDSQNQLTPLLVATNTSSDSLVKILLKNGADPNIIDGDRNTPLYIACDSNHYSIASQLIYNHVPANPNVSDLPHEKYPLWISCLRGYLDITELLVEEKSDLNIQQGKESLLEACHKRGQHEVVRVLLEYGADPATLSTVDLKMACHHGYAERAIAISKDATMDELKVCISEACNEGFPETSVGIIISISDKCKQKELSKVLQQISSPDPQSPLSDASNTKMQEQPQLTAGTSNRKSQEEPSSQNGPLSRKSQEKTQLFVGSSIRKSQKQPPLSDGTLNRKSQQPPAPDGISKESQKQFRPTEGTSSRESQDQPPALEDTSNNKSQEQPLKADDTSNNESQKQVKSSVAASNSDLQPSPPDGTSNTESQEQPLTSDDTSNNESQKQFQPSTGASSSESQDQPPPSDGTSKQLSQEQPLTPDDTSHNESQKQVQPSAGTSSRGFKTNFHYHIAP